MSKSPHSALSSSKQNVVPKDELQTLCLRVSKKHGHGVSLVDWHPLGEHSQVERYRFDNGLTVLLSVDPTAPVLAYQTWFRVGSRHEQPGRTGMAHLFEHLMFKGTAQHPEGAYDRLMERAGVTTDAATWLDWTYYRAHLPKQELPMVIELESDRARFLGLNTEQLEAERSVVMNERRQRVDNDAEGKMFEELYRLAFSEHPYGWPTLGWMEDIEAIGLADCQEFYRVFYSSGNAVVVVVGDQDREDTLGRLLDAYGPMEKQPIPDRTPPSLPEQTEERRVELRLPVNAPRVVTGYGCPEVGHPDVPALEILSDIIFNGESSRLHRELVREREIATGVSGWTSGLVLPGLFEVFLSLREGVEPEQADELVCAELSRVAAEPPSKREVEKACNRLEADFVRDTISVGARARSFGSYEVTMGDYRQFFDVVDQYRRVAVEDVARVAARYLRPERRSVVTALPSGEEGGAAS